MKPTAVVFADRTTIFLSGPPGSGKTSLGVRRLLHLLEKGTPSEQILILVPHRVLATPYYEAISGLQLPAGGQVDVATLGGLARRTIDLFWPVVARPAGFTGASLRPRFLTLETAQYYMGRIIQPFVEAGAFEGVTISRARLVSQAIDNLNKSAAVGFPVDDIAARLGSAWSGVSARLHVFEQVQIVAAAFRAHCLSEDLLDWSLQIELFTRHLLPLPQLRRYLLSGYRHLIVDNVEEDIPATHDLLRLWLPLAESALVMYDEDGGHRVFLGADPVGALALAQLCHERVRLRRSHVASSEMAALGRHLSGRLGRYGPAPRLARQALVLPVESIRFHPQMLDWVAKQVSSLLSDGSTTPAEIAILAPFVSDSLRFSLGERLARYGVLVQSHRPSRQLREEPAVRCLLTLAKLAHPTWMRPPPPEDVAQALTQAVADLDPVRASLVVAHSYRRQDGRPVLIPFNQLGHAVQERLSYVLGGRYAELVSWLEQQEAPESQAQASPAATSLNDPLDRFLSRLFGEVLTQPGFGFHHNLAAGAAAAMLIESVRKFRLTLSGFPATTRQVADLGPEYVEMVETGVVAAQYIPNWQLSSTKEAVLLVPAYTFLMMNRPVRFQFWLDAGSSAWHERIFQPLTHPYVLRRDWPRDSTWTDDDEVRVRDAALCRLILGLCHRCRDRVYLAYCELNERGYEQQGPLLQAVQRLLRQQEVQE